MSRNHDSRNPPLGSSRTLLLDEDLVSDLVRLLLRYASRANGSGGLGAGQGAAEAAPGPRDLFALLGQSPPDEAPRPEPVEPPSEESGDSKNVRPGPRLKDVDPAPRARRSAVRIRTLSGGAPFSSPEDPAWGFWRQAIYLPEDEIEEEARDLVRWLELETAPREVRAAAGRESGED